MRFASRILVGLITILVGWLAAAPTALALAAPAHAELAYAHDSWGASVALTNVGSWRGPSASNNAEPANLDGHPSSASLACLGVCRAPASTHYDNLVRGANGVGADATAQEPVDHAVGELSLRTRLVVAAKGGSALADASTAAFKAADGASSWAPSAKHLAGAGGRWQKFAEGADPSALAQEALRSRGATFLPDKTAGRFIVDTDLGRPIGTKGETWLKVVISDGGDIITGYPVKR